jgi:hypothetical protein
MRASATITGSDGYGTLGIEMNGWRAAADLAHNRNDRDFRGRSRLVWAVRSDPFHGPVSGL